MIRGPEDQGGNSYRILRVLTNKDYLSIDQHQLYHILCPQSHHQSPPSHRHPHRPLSHPPDPSPLLYPTQSITVGTLTYHVFPVSSLEVGWASLSAHPNPNSSSVNTILSQSIFNILPPLLQMRVRRVRECLDVRNAVWVEGELKLLMMGRGKKHPHSLSRSQKKHNLSPSHGQPLQEMYSVEMAILREYGLFLWRLLYDKLPIPSQTPKNEAISTPKQLITSMIQQQITYDFLKIKMRSLQPAFSHPHRIHKHHKIHFLKKNNLHQQHTQQEVPLKFSEGRSNSRFQTAPVEEETLPCRRKKLTLLQKRRRLKTQLQTENRQDFVPQNLSMINQRIWTSTRPSPLSHHQVRVSHSRNAKFEDWLTNTQLSSFKAKLKRQGDTAKKKFSKIISQSHTSNKQEDERFGQLRSRLATRMDRLKTEMMSRSQEKEVQSRRSQSRVVQYGVKRRLFQRSDEMRDQIGIREGGQAKRAIIDQKKQTLVEQKMTAANASQLDQLLQYKKEVLELMKDSKSKDLLIIENPLHSRQQPPYQQQQPSKAQNRQKNQEMREFKKLGQIQCACQTHPLSPSLVPIEQPSEPSNTTEFKCKAAPSSNPPSEPGAPPSTPLLLNDPLNPNRVGRTSQDSSSLPTSHPDQIEEIFLQQRTSNPHPPTHPLKPPNPTTPLPLTVPHPSRKQSTPHYDSVEESIEEYLGLVNVLGEVCLGVIRRRDHLSLLHWRKPLYFVYERFLYQRTNFVEAVGIRAKPHLRESRQLKEEELDEWLQSEEAQQLCRQMSDQNSKIQREFDLFAARTLEQCKFQKKVDYFIRNRGKMGSKSRQLRPQLTKIGAGSLIEIYDKVLNQRINSKPIFDFMLDCLLGVRVMSQLDGLLPQKYWVDLEEYGKYHYDLNRTNEVVEVLYKMYFGEESK